MTEGWSRPESGETGASAPVSPLRSEAPSPWWSDALRDPWRDPDAPAAIVVRARPAPTDEPRLAPDPAPVPLRPSRLVAVAVVTAVLVGTLAGAIGGALGYTYARHGGVGTVLGADPAGQGRAAQPEPGSLAEVVERVLPSVVTIRSGGLGGSTLGSGFVISTAGHVLTNDHVVGEASSTTVTFHDGSTAPATLVGRDPESDIAVLRVEARVPPVQLGDSESVRVGDTVLAIGSPLALANTVTAGIVSAVDRAIQAGDPGGQVRYYAAIQTDAAVNQGNSGGPLVDAAGRVIGINSVIKSVSMNETEAANIGLAFAIPISHGKRVAQEIIDTGRARRTVLGAELERTVRAGETGVRLAAVAEGGPAAEAGLRPGDVLVSLNGRPLQQPLDLIALVRKYAPGTVVTVEYRRGGVSDRVSVTLAAAD